jgi:hypothetical protein
MRSVGNLYDYFSAADDQTAATTLEHSPDPARFEVLDVRGIEPAVQLGMLEALLRDVDYETVAADPRQCTLIGSAGDEGPWVVTLTDTLRDALADANPDHLARTAVPWSRTEEFYGDGAADLLADFLNRIAGLARSARDQGHRLYCWMSL